MISNGTIKKLHDIANQLNSEATTAPTGECEYLAHTLAKHIYQFLDVVDVQPPVIVLDDEINEYQSYPPEGDDDPMDDPHNFVCLGCGALDETKCKCDEHIKD